MKSIFGIFLIFGLILSLSALPLERINVDDEKTPSQTHIRVRRQWGMPMGGWGMPMGGGFGGPMGGWGMPYGGMPMASRSHGHATKFTSFQMPFFSFMSGSTSGTGSSFMAGKK